MLVAIIAGLFLGIFLGFLNKNSGYRVPVTKADNSLGDISANPKPWEDEIVKVGAQKAYETFKDHYKDSFNSHNSLHIFSGLMYKKAGTESVVVCDDSFQFGCYHGFFTAALVSEGEGVINKLDQVCVDKFGPGLPGCQHGIGHGLIEYLGPQKLSNALDLCSSLTWKGKIYGCVSGVFMEFNMPFLIDGDKAVPSVRDFNEEAPYYPCNVVDSRYQSSCYYELGHYYNAFDKGDYKRFGKLCLGVEDLSLRKYCFLGLGHYAPQALNNDINRIIEVCSDMPSYEYEAYCKMGAVQSLFVDHRDQVPVVCEGLAGEDKDLCNSGSYYSQKKII